MNARCLAWRFPLALLVLMIGAPAFGAAESGEEFFENHVRPLLSEHCWECHAQEVQESELRLDQRASALQGGLSGSPAVVPGDPDASMLIQAVRYDGDLQMPPTGKLEDEQIEILRQWIAMGAPWPEGPAVPPDPMAERIADDREHHWAYQPVQRPALPQVQDPSWCQTPLDRFILKQLEDQGLEPSGPADRRTLLRRLSFDLVGTPPKARQVAQFEQDRRPDAYQQHVDRLLASPHFGERWGRHWLDVARYADTRGYAFARERRFPFAYTYRDYVIDAWNADLPYDRFIVEQLAADKLDLGDDRSALAALGFLTVGRHFNNVHDDIDDRIDVVTRGFLGLTVACARCHDHKFDAIPTEDYYSLYGIFASCHEPDELPLLGAPDEVAKYREYLDELNRRRGELDAFLSERHQEILEHARSHVAGYLMAVVRNPAEEASGEIVFRSLDPGDLRPDLVRRWRDYLKRAAEPDHPTLGPWRELTSVPDDQFAETIASALDRYRTETDQQLNPVLRERLLSHPPTSRLEVAGIYGQVLEETYAKWKEAGGNDRALRKLPPEWRQLGLLLFDSQSPAAIEKNQVPEFLSREDEERYNALKRRVEEQQVRAPEELPRAMILADNSQPTQPVVFIRGNHNRRGKEVPRQFLAILAPERKPFSQGSGRLELARAIANPRNPLTARVIVNRVWMHHFGQPLVESPSDFGIRTEPPIHRELLDYLADRLVRSGWSLKALHREILLSSTYQQSSQWREAAAAEDPENRLYWRMNRRRLEFEPMRDSLLAVAGLLDQQMGGKPVDIFDPPPYSHRRTVYASIDRQDLPNLLRTFDFASPDQSAASRPETTVPQQALYLMNSPLMQEVTQGVLNRPEIASAGEVDERIDRLYRLLFQRSPTSQEREVAERLLGARQAGAPEGTSSGPDREAWRVLVQMLLMTNEFVFVD